MTTRGPEVVDGGALDRWCRRELGSRPVRPLFEKRHLSAVTGVELADGRRVVIKVRPPSARVAACVEVQRHLFRHGFPCPEPLAGPSPFGSGVATAERYAPAGAPPAAPQPGACARLLGELVGRAPEPGRLPMLQPAPPWVGWDQEGSRMWPFPDDLDIDLNDCRGPEWVDKAAVRVRARLAVDDRAGVIGHVDWEAHNIGWDGDQPAVVYDWDSIAVRSEAAIAGVASAVYPSAVDGPVAATIAQSEAFLDAYPHDHREWQPARIELAWAAGLWVLVFNAKKQSAGGGAGYLEHLRTEVGERLRRAGA